jgi:hypothetical protein
MAHDAFNSIRSVLPVLLQKKYRYLVVKGFQRFFSEKIRKSQILSHEKLFAV